MGVEDDKGIYGQERQRMGRVLPGKEADEAVLEDEQYTNPVIGSEPQCFAAAESDVPGVEAAEVVAHGRQIKIRTINIFPRPPVLGRRSFVVVAAISGDGAYHLLE